MPGTVCGSSRPLPDRLSKVWWSARCGACLPPQPPTWCSSVVMSPRADMRRLPPIAGLILAALLLTGCSDGAITDTRIQNSVGATFANLWDLQQSEQGHPHAPVGALQSQASCHRSDPAEAAVGAANDWVC